MFIVLLVLGVIGAGLIGFHQFKSNILKQVVASRSPSQLPTVATVKATVQDWQPALSATGTLRASDGAELSAEIAGIVGEIHFTSGQDVEAGTLLLRLRPNDDEAKLQQLQATAELDQITYDRDQRQLRAQGVVAGHSGHRCRHLKNARAQVAAQQALMAEKFVRAPFAGRLGIRQVDLGQYLSRGHHGRDIAGARPDLRRFLSAAAGAGGDQGRPGRHGAGRHLSGPRLSGRRSQAINPKVDTSSRMVQVRATPQERRPRACCPGCM